MPPQSEPELRIDTPEQVALALPIAGVGSRFLALAFDTLLQVAAYLAVFFAAAFMSSNRLLPAAIAAIGPAAAVLAGFVVYWGYFAIFEALWSGRTPGKRAAHIRVVKESGRAINGYEAAIRNVMRAVDFLPVMYGLGVVVMMLNDKSRRLGDYVAGTFVIHERPPTAMPLAAADRAVLDGAVADLSRVTADELVLIETYLQRRPDLDVTVSDAMAEQIASRIERRTGVRREPGLPASEFLEIVARRVRDTARFR